MRQILKQRRGQATVEYLLLIAVVIALALSIGKPLGNYLKGLSGAMLGPDNSYYACLMEHAELPGNSVSCQAKLEEAVATPLNLPDAGGPGAGDSGGGRSGGSGNDGGGGSDEEAGGEDSDSGTGEESEDRNGGRDSAADRAALSSKHRAGSNVRGGSSTGSGRDQTQAEFVAFRPSSSSAEEAEEAEEAEAGSGRKRLRRKRKRGSGPKFGSEQEGYKQNLNRNRSEFAVAYLGERFVEEEEKESKKVFKSPATTSSFAGSGPGEEDPKSIAPGEALTERGPSEEPEVKQMNLMGLIRYIVLAVLIILVLAFVFSQAMEYQSRD